VSKAKKFALADTDSSFIQILSEDSDLGKRIAAALEQRIAREFMTGEDIGPKKGKKAKKGGAK
jgi:hypothetical protein